MTSGEAGSALHRARDTYAGFLAAALRVRLGGSLDPPPGSAAQRMLRLDILHTDTGCPIAMADACVVIGAPDPAVRFVAPAVGGRAGYVGYWERLAHRQAWRPMGDDSVTSTPDVCVVAQTLPGELGAGRGAGHLHVVHDRPDDGWTFVLGVLHTEDVEALTGLALTVTVSARPDWTPRTPDLVVVLP